METLIINIPNKKSALVKQILKGLGVTVKSQTKNSLKPSDNSTVLSPALPTGKRISPIELLEDFGKAPDFPSTEEIRAKAWSAKW